MAHQKDKGIVENFFRRDGRLNRWRYFKRTMVVALVMAIIITANIITDMNALGQLSPTGDIIFKGVSLASLIPIFCLMVRRLHDIRKTCVHFHRPQHRVGVFNGQHNDCGAVNSSVSFGTCKQRD